MASNYTQKQIMDLLNEFKGDEKISSNQYPNVVEELQGFLSLQGIDFNETDFEVKYNTNGIDSDGYPWLKKEIIIKSVNVLVEIIVYHHTEWDFYIDGVKDC